MMETRRYLKQTAHPHPHIGQWVRKIMKAQKLTQAELARRMNVSPNSLANYFKQPSLQFGILWNIGLALEYDFLTEFTNYYPAGFTFNDNSKIIKELNEKKTELTDLYKEISIYKKALGIKD